MYYSKQSVGEVLKIRNELIMNYLEGFIFIKLPAICLSFGLKQGSPILPHIFLPA